MQPMTGNARAYRLLLWRPADVDSVSEKLRSVIETLSDVGFRVWAHTGKSFKLIPVVNAGELSTWCCGNFESRNGMESNESNRAVNSDGRTEFGFVRNSSSTQKDAGHDGLPTGGNGIVEPETPKSAARCGRKFMGSNGPCKAEDAERQAKEGNSLVAHDPDCEPLYPIPLSPLSGEAAQAIEYERAMAAEAAMKSGPALTRSEVLFEDEWLLVINKPCGVYSEHVLATVPFLVTDTAALLKTPSLSRLTLGRPIDNGDPSHLHMANRLDRDTSGVMVITKRREAAGKLSNIFTRRLVQKSYVGLCSAPRPSWTKVTVDSGHGRSRFGAWRVYSKKDVGKRLPGGSVVKDMTTHLAVLAINRRTLPQDETGITALSDIDNLVTAGSEGCSSGVLPANDAQAAEDSVDEVLIRAVPLTGRTHQIRLHSQFVGLPLREMSSMEGVTSKMA